MELTLTDKNNAMAIVQELFALGFGSVIVNKDAGRRSFWDWKDSVKESLDEDFDFASGCTKWVVMHPALGDWVLKFPMEQNIQRRLRRFVTEDDEEPAADYCALEVRNYERAVASKLEHFFAATYKLCDYEGFPVYIQQKAECDESAYEDSFYEYCSSSYDKEDFDCDDDYYDAVSSATDDMTDEDSVVAIFGGCAHDGLVAFIYNNIIGDLHAGNYGHVNDHPVLIDYSGY